MMKAILTSTCIFIVSLCAAQANKFEQGDFGMRYSVVFNGAAVQGLTFSGMVTNNIEVGCGVNVQYSTNSSTNNSANYVEVYVSPNYIYYPATLTSNVNSKTINTSLTPFVFYHFKINNNLDVYTGPGLILGTGAHTLGSFNDQVTTATNYYNETYTKTTYPIGYQVGGNWNIGGQYFFYKRLAVGVQANLGVAYNSTDGTEKSIYNITNTGTNNTGVARNLSSTVYAPYISRGLSLTSASSIGVNLTFYLAQKKRIVKAPAE